MSTDLKRRCQFNNLKQETDKCIAYRMTATFATRRDRVKTALFKNISAPI